MKKALLLTAALMLAPWPAWSQGGPHQDEREYGGDRREFDMDRAMRDFGDDVRGGGGSRRGGSFLLRSGDATVAVRCDPRESMRTCVEATITLLEKARAVATQGGAAAPR